jgi:hypothetical protein
MDPETRQHPELGSVKWEERLHAWEANVTLAGSTVFFLMIVEGDWEGIDPGDLFEIGARFLRWARKFEPRCRDRVVNDLYELYTRWWAGDDTGEGPSMLSRPEFHEVLHPCLISLYHDGSSDWQYECGDLFAGHGIDLYVDADGVLGRADLWG